MADGVAITAGSGTTIATDDAGTPGHVQLFKLAISTDGSATLIPADAANGLDVDVTRLPALVAGTASIGTVQLPTTTSATVAQVASSASNVANLIASNSSAKARKVFNDSTAVLYLKFGTTASTTSYTVQLAAGAYYEFPVPLYTGRVDGIWASANGNAYTTEET